MTHPKHIIIKNVKRLDGLPDEAVVARVIEPDVINAFVGIPPGEGHDFEFPEGATIQIVRHEGAPLALAERNDSGDRNEQTVPASPVVVPLTLALVQQIEREFQSADHGLDLIVRPEGLYVSSPETMGDTVASLDPTLEAEPRPTPSEIVLHKGAQALLDAAKLAEHAVSTIPVDIFDTLPGSVRQAVSSSFDALRAAITGVGSVVIDRPDDGPDEPALDQYF